MALIAMAVFDTEDNKRSNLTSRTIQSLIETVSQKHRIVIIDNASCKKTKDIIATYVTISSNISVITNDANIGTAKAVNKALRMREPGEVCVKMDNDVVFKDKDWIDSIEDAMKRDPKIGICGLKRKDLMESPSHPDRHYRSMLYMIPHNPGEDWIVAEQVLHVMGTCQAFSPELLDTIGYLYQMNRLYGFDDSLMSLRSRLAGFKNVFLPSFRIDHIDPGGDAYTTWKQDSASESMHDYNSTVSGYVSGRIPLKYEGE